MTETIQRLDYIGSKYQLLDWLTTNIQQKTGWTSFEGKSLADLFGGTGIVSYHFRTLGAKVISNDAELYSSIITKAFTSSTYTPRCKDLIDSLNTELTTQSHIGYMTTHYSPHSGPSETCERMFFTNENAKKLDYVRKRLEELRSSLSEEEYTFILASLLISADKISNTPAVYGCYLKNFKKTAQKPFSLVPIHTRTVQPIPGSSTYKSDVLSQDLLNRIDVDVVYLDPPYNERQYSKNYFPLNQLAKNPSEVLTEPPLKGKTGIPMDCFLSPFCKKGKLVEDAFEKVCRGVKAKWIFISYNSESLIPKARMLEILQKLGKVSVVEADYKRFKSFQYNKDKEIQEYLFCLEKA
jgi:adenine-specific DNA-methyltransferase